MLPRNLQLIVVFVAAAGLAVTWLLKIKMDQIVYSIDGEGANRRNSSAIMYQHIYGDKYDSEFNPQKPCFDIKLENPHYCVPGENGTLEIQGIPFDLPLNLLRKLGMPLTQYVLIKREELNDFVFVTAADDQYFHVAMDAIGNIQKHFRNHTIYFYDLSDNRSETHINKIRRICQVVYRQFNYSRYPTHVRHLKQYTFKPLILHEMLSEFPRVFWIDSSIRFKTGDLNPTLDEVYQSGGIIMFERSIHSNFEATHQGMYDFFPISTSDAANTAQYGANSIYFVRTEQIYKRIIFWWVLCALREDCMAAGREKSCNFTGKAIWAGCHRFDQAALNILTTHHFKYDVGRYTSRHNQLEVWRYSDHRERIHVCASRFSVKSAKYFSR